MFSQIVVLATVALSVAAGTAPHYNTSKYTCNTGAIQCCNQVEQAGSQNAAAIVKTVAGVAAQGITGLVGAQCSPVTVVGTGSGADCVSAPICCEDNQIHGLVAIGCSAASIKA